MMKEAVVSQVRDKCLSIAATIAKQLIEFNETGVHCHH